jgi:hypothetical protein
MMENLRSQTRMMKQVRDLVRRGSRELSKAKRQRATGAQRLTACPEGETTRVEPHGEMPRFLL